MARPDCPTLPLWMVLILVLCLISLAGHFLTESLGPQGMFSATEIGGHYDDNFVLFSMPRGQVDVLVIRISGDTTRHQKFFCLSPLLPPPNL